MSSSQPQSAPRSKSKLVLPRIVIDDIHPRTPTGRFPAKASVGEVVSVTAVAFKDGHDYLAARVKWRRVETKADNVSWSYSFLDLGIGDHWSGKFQVKEIGLHEFVIEAWVDFYQTWKHKLQVKLQALQDVSVELAEGANYFSLRQDEPEAHNAKEMFASIAKELADESLTIDQRLELAFRDEVGELVLRPSSLEHVTESESQLLWVDRTRALFGSWYELFPRSVGGLKGLVGHLGYVAEMGFDILYLPPIHPIGASYRKGKNNSLNAGSGDVGSPWAIGSNEGGHLSVNPALGSIEDFDEVVKRAEALGIEIALDYALQCSPDHPWVSEHPEWFNHRPDGTIAYAENPPKKYQDIYPINFWPEKESDRVALWNACKEIIDFWISHGVRIFRVDNPHTKPITFWTWLIKEVQDENPDVFFLAEAFTRPAVMSKLAEIGFSQSYTYFTWRTQKWDLTEYVVEVAVGEKSEFMRPNFWPTTPDILAEPLRNAPLSAFKQRLVLAATLSPSYGMYSGYELGENEPMSSSNEEYLNSEKYEIRNRDFASQFSLAPLIKKLNAVRKTRRSLQELRNVYFHSADNDKILCYSKRSSDGSDTVLVVVNIDPYHSQECTLSLNLEELGVAWNEPFEVFDELTQRPFYWWGAHNYVHLSPNDPAHILSVRTGR